MSSCRRLRLDLDSDVSASSAIADGPHHLHPHQGRQQPDQQVFNPSPVTELANDLLISAHISGTPPSASSAAAGSRLNGSWYSSDDSEETPTTALVLGGGRRLQQKLLSQRSLRMVRVDGSGGGWSSSDELMDTSAIGGGCESASSSASLRRHRSLPLRHRLLAAASAAAGAGGAGDDDKENAPSPMASAVSKSIQLKTHSAPAACESGGLTPARYRRQPLVALQRSLSSSTDHYGNQLQRQQRREEFCFAAPTARPPRGVRSNSSSSSSSGGCGGTSTSPCVSSAPTTAGASLDGFLDAIDLDTMNESAMPNGLQELLSAPILHVPSHEEGAGAVTGQTSRSQQMWRSLSMVERPSFGSASRRDCIPVPGRHGQYKRSEPPICHSEGEFSSALASKRLCPDPQQLQPQQPPSGELYRSGSYTHCTSTDKVQVLQRCHSESEASIKKALQRSCQDPDLISDFTRPYALPLCATTSKNADLRPVSCDTVAALMAGQYADTVASYQIVDCRYPYEFEGGHIRGAVNLYVKDDVHSHLLGQRAELPPLSLDVEPKGKRHVLIFHCEFSSERGPSMFRFVRSQDRNINHQSYPALHYPEIYLLEGGYKKFFGEHPQLCDPLSYKPMNKEGHEHDLKHFRAKSKSWAGDSKARGVSKRIIL